MASYVGWTGHIQADSFAKDIKNMTYAKAYQEFYNAYQGVSKGLGGFTKNDANGLIKMANALTSQFGSGVNTSKIVADLNYIIKNNKYNDNNTLLSLESNISNVSPKSLTGSTTGNVAKNTAGQTVVTKGANASTNTSTSKPSTTTTTTTTTKPVTTGTGGGTGTSQLDTYTAWLQQKNEELDKRIYELEHPKVMTADELAAFHGIDYNEQHILDEYNDRTNQYYQDAIDQYYDLRNNLVGQASRNNQRTINDYLGEWTNAAPTAARRGELAANALSAYMNSNYDLNAEDYALNQAQNGLRSEWEAELAANPNTAKQQYNSMGTTLASLSSNLNTSQVKQYIDQLDAYSQMYAANRAVSSAAAQGVASQYAGLANAAATNASTSAASYNSWQQLYNYYKNAYGATDKQASTAVTNNLQQSSGINKNT